MRTWTNSDESKDTLFYLTAAQATALNIYVQSGHGEGRFLEEITAIIEENANAGMDHIAGLWVQAHGRRLEPTTYTVTGF